MKRDMNLARPNRFVAVTIFAAIIGCGFHPAKCAAPGPSAWAVKSASDVEGKLEIVLQSGRTITVKPAQYQCSFEAVTVANDGVTVGWIEGGSAYSDGEPPCAPGHQFVGDGPFVWRGGKVVRTFDESGADIGFSFEDGGRLIAVHAGPTHFDDNPVANLYDIATGRKLKTWSPSEKGNPPQWAADVISLYPK